MKECSGCHQSKPTDQFYRQAAAKDGLNPQCKECINKRNRAYHELNRERMIEWRRRSSLRRWAKQHLGIEAEDYNNLLIRAAGCCEVCGRPERSMSTNGHSFMLALDHDHATMQVRGMLCRPCNTALGCVQDDPNLLHKLADYLEHPPGLPEPGSVSSEQRAAHAERDTFGQSKRPRTGWKQRPETRAKMSAALKGIPSKYKGVARSAEVRAKIRATNTGQKRSDEARANMRAARLRYLAAQKFV